MNSIFPVEIFEEILNQKRSSDSTESTTVNQNDKETPEKPSLANIDGNGDSQKFSENLTAFLMSSKEKSNREEKIDKANQLGLV